MRNVVRTSLLAILALGLAACSLVPLPSVSEVESDTVASSDIVTVRSGEPTTVTIRGSDFGDPRGLNRLFYAGFEVNDDAIASWTDDTIVLEYLHPAEILGDDLLRSGAKSLELTVAAVRGTYVAPDEQRFEVRTAGGSVASEPVRFVVPRLSVNYASGPGVTVDVSLYAQDLFGHPWPDLDVALEANRGTLATTTLVTDTNGVAQTTLTTANALPHAVKVIHDGRSVAQDATLEYQAGPSFHSVTPETEATIGMTLTDSTAALVTGVELDWILVSEVGPRFGLYDLGTHATDASGSVELTIPPLPSRLGHDLFVVEDGYLVETAYVRPEVLAPF